MRDRTEFEMMEATLRHIVAAFTLAIALAAFPAIYARAHMDPSSGAESGRPAGGCNGMMNGGSADAGMMSSRQAHGGTMGGGMGGGGMTRGGERPNQQWRR
jgi:hypothetical protein